MSYIINSRIFRLIGPGQEGNVMTKRIGNYIKGYYMNMNWESVQFGWRRITEEEEKCFRMLDPGYHFIARS